MKILLLGKNGQVGFELQRTLALLGKLTALGRQELDLTDLKAVSQTISTIKPDIIVNAAAYTAVDQAEEEPELAMAVNGTAPGILAEETKKINALLVHYSTDYIFDGKKNIPYTEVDEPNPINIYGKTKLAGEKAIQETGADHLILRTSWVYGLRGRNFLKTILRLAAEKEELSIVDDQLGSPTWCRMIAEATALLLAMYSSKTETKSGIFNLCSSDLTSWYGFARAILDNSGNQNLQSTVVKPIPSAQYKTRAARPSYSVLDNRKIKEEFNLALPSWQESLKLALEQ